MIESDDPSYKQTHQGPWSASGTSQNRAVNGAETRPRPKRTTRRLQTRVDHPCHVTLFCKVVVDANLDDTPFPYALDSSSTSAQVELVTAEGRDCEPSRRVGKSRFGSRADRQRDMAVTTGRWTAELPGLSRFRCSSADNYSLRCKLHDLGLPGMAIYSCCDLNETLTTLYGTTLMHHLRELLLPFGPLDKSAKNRSVGCVRT